jgi:SAM-dependent methyltransferase
MEREAFRAMAATENEHWWFVGRREIIRSLIETRIGVRGGLRILEAGCGTGGNLALLREYGDLAAFEYDDNARAHARLVSGIDVMPGALPDGIDHITGPFDLIALLDVLEHVEQDRAAVRALAGRLSAGGAMIVTVPALQFLWSEHDTMHHHHRRYSRSLLVETLQAGGLKVEYVSYFNSFLFPAALVQRLVSRIAGDIAGDPNAMPPAPLNRVLAKVFACERAVLKRMRLPVGLSLCAICRAADG